MEYDTICDAIFRERERELMYGWMVDVAAVAEVHVLRAEKQWRSRRACSNSLLPERRSIGPV